MCTAELFSARSNAAGMCQNSITALSAATLTQGRSSQPPAARSGRAQPPRITPAVALRPVRQGRPSISGCHGAPATISIGAANISSRCWIMCTKK